jgi:DNA-binding SARP family transcriptional activator
MAIAHQLDPVFREKQEIVHPSSIALKEGLSYVAQGRLAEGLEALRHAREQLTTQEAPLGDMLDALQEIMASFLQAERLLNEAGRRLAEARLTWQSQLGTLSFLLQPHVQLSLSTPAVEPLAMVTPVPLEAHPQHTACGERPIVSALSSDPPPLYITCFGHFTVSRFHVGGPSVQLCRNARGQLVFRYLLTRPGHQASVDMLLADLWPDEEPETARHKLQIAVSALRCALNEGQAQPPGGGYILYKERSYILNPAVAFNSDVADLLHLFEVGNRAGDSGITSDCYQRACRLYSGPFLVEDLYAEWSFLQREELARTYRTMCSWLAEHRLREGDCEEALSWCRRLLQLDRYDEETYCKIMRAYAGAGRRTEALRCYQQCRRLLLEELHIEPMPETQALIQAILDGRYPPDA